MTYSKLRTKRAVLHILKCGLSLVSLLFMEVGVEAWGQEACVQKVACSNPWTGSINLFGESERQHLPVPHYYHDYHCGALEQGS